jgi:spore coat polysaccharide biosynthesis protein SpsF
MGSVRLPGKVLMDIAGRPILWHIINRLNRCRLINQIVVATSINVKDDAIEQFCKENNVHFYRGKEKDVLDRYYQTAIAYEADVVIRITADCPLIDPTIVDKVIHAYLSNKKTFDGASNTINRTYPRGLDTEVISFFALQGTWKKATKDYEREHVTIFMYEHADSFRLYSVENNADLSHLRWTVDENEDLDFAREVFKRLYNGANIFLMEDILRVLEKEPRLAGINRNIKQKISE